MGRNETNMAAWEWQAESRVRAWIAALRPSSTPGGARLSPDTRKIPRGAEAGEEEEGEEEDEEEDGEEEVQPKS